MDGRHEVKHYISVADYDTLRARLGAVLKRDVHAGAGGTYLVRSLYFDTGEDRALYEKLDGVRDRDKYRLRYYDYNTGFIQLEKKSKHSDLCVKKSERVTREEVIRILDGNLGWMKEDERPLLKELYGKMEKEHLMPKTIVDYTRDPFVFPAGNVRVTLDHHIRAGMNWQDFLKPDAVTIPIPEDPVILEVKWDHFLPDVVKAAVQTPNRQASAFSKYAACRVYDF